MKESAASEIKTASASVQRKAGASSPLFDEPGARNGPLMSIVQRAGCSGCPPALASLAGRMAEMPPGSRKEAALSLQRAKGNRFVQRLAVQAKDGSHRSRHRSPPTAPAYGRGASPTSPSRARSSAVYPTDPAGVISTRDGATHRFSALKFRGASPMMMMSMLRVPSATTSVFFIFPFLLVRATLVATAHQ